MTIGDKIKGVDVLRALADGNTIRRPDGIRIRLDRLLGSFAYEVINARRDGTVSSIKIEFTTLIDGREFEVVG